ncbi:hypothetical protein F4808DRAFT_398806 [Astrocystis sublimbata]|nr:hypothetical protein F4808DRAFT_398806 [Astrocystis sublimbata]
MTASGPAEQANYASTALTILILLTRISLWLWRRERIDISFILVVLSVVVVVSRIIVNAFYLRYGNAADVIKHAGYFDEKNLADVMTGSILVLVARVMITTILWLQIVILLIFNSRITCRVNWVAMVVKITWGLVAISYVANVLTVFLECQPITLYWQVTPDPGTCVKAWGQLYAQTISNIVLDVLLIAIAYPIVNLRKRSIGEHLTLYLLFALGTFCIIISVIRIISVRDSGSSQVIRSLWASVQMLVSTFVANAPNIYGSIRAVRMIKKSTANSGPTPNYGLNSSIHNRSRPGPHDSWMKMDSRDNISLSPVSPSYSRPHPIDTTLYDDRTALSPHSHQFDLEDSIPRDGPSRSSIAVASSRTQSPDPTQLR